MKNLRIVLYVIFAFAVIGCTTTPDQIVIQRNDVSILERPQSITLEDVNFSTTNIDGTPYFILTAQDYQSLSINVQKMIKYSKDSLTIIENYEDMIEKSNQQIEH